jgi:hypothetical protein
MQKISLSSLRISELIENPRPSTHKRRLFSRFALGMIGMHDSTGTRASFRANQNAGQRRRRTRASLCQVLLHKARAQMNVHLHQWAIPDGFEAVNLAGFRVRAGDLIIEVR